MAVAAWGAEWVPSWLWAVTREGKAPELWGRLWEVRVRVSAWSQDRSSSEQRRRLPAWAGAQCQQLWRGRGQALPAVSLLCGQWGGVRKSCLGLVLPTRQRPSGCLLFPREPQPYLRALLRPLRLRVGCPGLLGLGCSGGNLSALPVGEGHVMNQQLEKWEEPLGAGVSLGGVHGDTLLPGVSCPTPRAELWNLVSCRYQGPVLWLPDQHRSGGWFQACTSLFLNSGLGQALYL